VSAEIPDDVPPDCTVYRLAKKSDIKPDGTPQSSCFSDKRQKTVHPTTCRCTSLTRWYWQASPYQIYGRNWGSEYTVLAFGAEDLRKQGERLWRDPKGTFPGHGACKRADDSERTQGQKRNLAKIAKIAPELQ
jgi:hypothetical protein